MNETQRVLSECDELGKSALGARYQIALGDAARLIREIAADLHTALDVYDGAGEINPEWIERARERWRLK